MTILYSSIGEFHFCEKKSLLGMWIWLIQCHFFLYFSLILFLFLFYFIYIDGEHV